MGLSNELSCEAGNFSRHCNLRLSFPTLWSFSLPSCSSRFTCMQMWDCLSASCPLACPSPPVAALPHVLLPPRLPISTLPTSLDECFFFNSLVVGLPYSSIFWQVWLFFVFKFGVLLLVVKEQSASTYTSILAGSLRSSLFKRNANFSLL